MSKYLDLAKKIKELASRGEGGEKVNAEKMLTDFCKKHKISIESLEDEKEDVYFFDIKEDTYAFDIKLLNQLAGQMSLILKGPFKKKDKKAMGIKENFGCKCTAIQHAELSCKFYFYKSALEKEADVFFYAFCIENDLLVDGNNEETISDEENDQYKRASLMSLGIKKSHFKKQLK